MRREYQERFPRGRGLAITTCITARQAFIEQRAGQRSLSLVFLHQMMLWL